VIAHQRRHHEIGQAHLEPEGPSTRKRSSVTSVSSGAPLSFQSGMSRLSATGIDHRAGQDVGADLDFSEPFSSTITTETFGLAHGLLHRFDPVSG
jgi:hypothetical protein